MQCAKRPFQSQNCMTQNKGCLAMSFLFDRSKIKLNPSFNEKNEPLPEVDSMIRPISFVLILSIGFALIRSALADEAKITVEQTKASLRVAGKYIEVELSLTQPQFLRLGVDSLGQGRFMPDALRSPPPPSRPSVARLTGTRVEYVQEAASNAPPSWLFEFSEKSITLVSQWTETNPPEPVVLDFNQLCCHATLLGVVDAKGAAILPSLLHLPDQGTFRITASGNPSVKLPYDARRAVGPYVKVTFPPATKETPRVKYHWEVTAIYPKFDAVENDPRFNGFRRNWLNIFQVNPRLGTLANNASSDTCAFCAYQYADVALHTPALADRLGALDMVRQMLDRYLSGKTGYGMPGYPGFDPEGEPNHNPIYLDSYPSLLIAAADYAIGSGNQDWLKANYDTLRTWTETVLKMDRDGDGLFDYALSGNSGSWPEVIELRACNWWDTIGFGHEDAYSNALAYRALRGMEKLADELGKTEDAARYRVAADKLKSVYLKTFYNPATGVLAGWKSADGELHDYYFLFVNGIAIHYGLVPREQANAIMDKLLAKMKDVGYTRFDLGLPGNLITVLRKDYIDKNPRFGGGKREDNADGFQIYENGGATGCFAYFTLAALYDLDRREEADRILFPMLDAFDKGSFSGRGPSGRTNDWRAWDGTAWGYEGFLVDNYYALLAVLARDGRLQKGPLLFGPEN
jgi:hypothetical protein